MTSSPWGESPRQLSGLPGGTGLNIAYEAVDRHASPPQGAMEQARSLRVAVPESEYHHLATLDGCIGYLAGKLGS